jgi:class 3 adenylate cyclase/predicted ATPase
MSGPDRTPPDPSSEPSEAQVRPSALTAGDAVAERRQLTVLFCDLVKSTALSTHLDPEAFREVIHAYHAACALVIERFDGYIAQYLGDGLLAYFGYPLAHEDDPQRAVRAGLGILEAVQQLHQSGQSPRVSGHAAHLQVRVAVHTGLVVIGAVGSGARQERLALGEVPNLAARLQSVATPETVVLSGTTFRLVEGWFVCEPLGERTLEGFPQPMAAYRVLRESGARSRLDITSPRGLTPLVGREPEVALLQERWAQVKDGSGQVVLLSGEAGIGKSRLVEAFKSHVADEPQLRWEARCSPYTQHSALYPVIDLFRRLLHFREGEGAEAQRWKLVNALRPFDVSLRDLVPLLASLLSIPLGDGDPALITTPEQQKQNTLEALLSLLLAMAAQQPVLCIVEDIHWADPSTLEFLGLLIDQVATARVLTILVFRPDFRPPWAFREHVSQLTLTRLTRHQAEIMATHVAARKALPPEVLHQVVTRTDGVPLFVEELTKMVLESGWLREGEDRYELTGPLLPMAIPATLSDSLMARLDRLSTVKTVAQLGAVIGRQFPYDLLHTVSTADEPTLQHALSRLVEAQILYQHGLLAQATYTFKHALIQEAAYESLLKSTRQEYHLRIAQALAAQFPTTATTQPEFLAHHYHEAGLPDQALPYWLQAGQRAVERSANAEAIGHLTKGLDVLRTLPETPERLRQELTFLLTLGAPLFMLKGHASLEVERVYRRALELSARVGDSTQRFAALMGLARFVVAVGQLRLACELREQSLALAQLINDPVLLREARLMLGTTLHYLGDLETARLHLERGLAPEAPQRSLLTTFSRGTNPEAFSLAHLAWTLWTMGYPDRALRTVREAVAFARQLAHPYSLALALHFAAALHRWRREAACVYALAEETIALSSGQGFDRWVAGCTMMRGWALAEQGLVAEGLDEVLRGLGVWRLRAGALGLPDYLPLLAEVYGKNGQPAAALDAITEALAVVGETEERRNEAELHRMRGDLLLRQAAQRRDPLGTALSLGDEAEAEACFHRAIATARSQRAKSLELRAVVSLSRLWQATGRGAEAHERLAETYGWFTEGFETPDLQEAKALLDRLP